jgi:hypothetical protein
MLSPPNENCIEVLRARYAELLRLREYVERLENLHQEDAPICWNDGGRRRRQETVDQRHD